MSQLLLSSARTSLARLFRPTFVLKNVRLLSNSDSKESIHQLVTKDDIVVFMKGTPDEPRCGFSNAVVQILRMHGVDDFSSYNILEDDVMRQAVKQYSDWPTYPQVYFKGDFIGGCDIMLQMHQSGDLVEELTKLGIRSALLDRSN